MNKSFWFGVAAGLVGSWAWHAFVRPLPTPKG